jgi:glyoxylase-like metal-dependent hydrolase (beta-lactamase superfamily II)
MTIEIKRLTLGAVSTNAYIVGDNATKEALVIDPVDNADILLQAAQDSGWTIKLILATHAHFDHVLASKELKERTGAPFWIHEECVNWLKMLPQMGQMFGLGEFPPAAEPDRLLTSESESIELGAIKLETLYTPGHAPGHLAFLMREHGIVFSGDTLFFSSIGRTDLPGGNHDLLLKSIEEKLLTLPDETRVLPGHMQETTIGTERRHNPFL